MYKMCIYALSIVILLLSVRKGRMKEYDRLPDYDTNVKAFFEDSVYYIKFSEVETLFLYKETQEFLNSFQDKEHRELIRQHLYYCPFISLCQFSFNLYSDTYVAIPACLACSCAQGCKERGDCCPDILDYAKWKRRNKYEPKTTKECSSKYVKLPAMPAGGYQLVYECDETDNVPQRYCDTNHDFLGKSLDDITPVTDTSSNISYINKECATCNNARPDRLAMWKTELVCQSDKNGTMSIQHNYFDVHESPIDYIGRERFCNIMFNPAGLQVNACTTGFISNCNLTGQWKVFDEFLLRACLFFQARYRLDIKEYLVYRNVFCALCNGFEPTSTTVSMNQGGGGVSVHYSFSSLLGFAGSDQRQRKIDQDCGHEMFFNPLQKKCQPLHCTPGRTLKADTCVRTNKDVHDTIFTDTVLIVPEEEIQFDAALIASIRENSLKWYTSMMGSTERLIQVVYPAFHSMAICDASFHYSFKQKCSKDGRVCEKSDSLEYLKMEIQIQVTGWLNANYIEKAFADIKTKRFEIIHFLDEVRCKAVSFRAHEMNSEIYSLGQKRWQSVSNYTEIAGAPCNENFSIITVWQQKSCPMVSLNGGAYDWYEKEFRLFVPGLNMKVDASYYMTANLSKAYVCFDKFVEHLYLILDQPSSTNFTPEHVLSLVCISLSLACLLFPLAIYTILPELNMPLSGKNTISLMSSLAVAQTLYIISRYGNLEHRSIACKTVGILSHFAWLVNIFWIGISTFHVLKMNTPLMRSTPSGNRHDFTLYVCTSVALAAIFVLVNILVSLLSTKFKQIGYERVSCTIATVEMVGFTLALPVGLVIVTNFALLCMWRMKTRSYLRRKMHIELSDIIILTKLSALAGFTCLLEIILILSGLDGFSFLFNFFSASQGVFLCLSYVCNRRVISLLKYHFWIQRHKT